MTIQVGELFSPLLDSFSDKLSFFCFCEHPTFRRQSWQMSFAPFSAPRVPSWGGNVRDERKQEWSTNLCARHLKVFGGFWMQKSNNQECRDVCFSPFCTQPRPRHPPHLVSFRSFFSLNKVSKHLREEYSETYANFSSQDTSEKQCDGRI